MKQTQKDEVMEIDLLRLAEALLHRIWIVILAMLIGGGLTLSYARFFITPLYRSNALLYVNSRSISLGATSIGVGDLNTSRSLVNTYLVILKTRLTLNEVIERAGLSYTYEQLSGMITAEAVNSTEVFRVIVTGPDPEETTLIANTITEVLPDKIEEIVEGSSMRVVDYAVVPAAKYSPSLTRYTLYGILLGLMLSAGVIVLLELFDDQIRDEEFLTENYAYSVLAVVPDLGGGEKSRGYYNRGYGGYGGSYSYSARAAQMKSAQQSERQDGAASEGGGRNG